MSYHLNLNDLQYSILSTRRDNRQVVVATMIVFSISNNNIMMLMTSSPSFCITTLSSLSSSNFARYFPAQTDELVGHTDQIMHLSVNPQPEISRNQICAARQPQLALTLALKATPITCSESIYCDVAQENLRQHTYM